ncbi:MAG: response regulator transcription factor [Bdellovibrionales bacterium]|nr:response regulator transcription factor [Bdellovibrionales bacterium]
MRVLLVEDEQKLLSFVMRGLAEHGYAVDTAATKNEAEVLAADNDYDLIILDVMLPDGNGVDLAKWLREHEYSGPILMLTALNSTSDKVKGLDAGADDYLSKPFVFEELMARVRALLRRYGDGQETSSLEFADIEMNLIHRKVTRAGQELRLTTKEFALLEYLMRNIGRPVTRTQIIEHVWDMGFDPGSNVVDVYVNMLRKKVDQPFEKKLIHTVVGYGYELRQEP